MEFKTNISDPKTGKTIKKVLKDDECKSIIGKRIGATVSGDTLGFPGYEFTITGGSDYCGFPMRRDVDGKERKKVLISSGVGIRNKVKGLRYRKTVAGREIYDRTAQVNLRVSKHGKDPLPEPEKKEAEQA
jgi:small subunit ribosomal protein S6e